MKEKLKFAAILLLGLFAACQTAKSNNAKTPTPLPEFYGFYVISGGNLFGFDVETEKTPDLLPIKIGHVASRAEIKRGKNAIVRETVEVPRFDSDVSFLLFMQSSPMVSAAAGIEDFILLRLPFIRAVDAVSSLGFYTPMNVWYSGQAKLNSTKEIGLLRKPVAGQPEMAQSVPVNQLEPGVYLLAMRNWLSGYPKPLVYFTVGSPNDAESQACINLVYTKTEVIEESCAEQASIQ